MPEQPENNEKNTKSRQGIQVIARAASILRALENVHDGLSLGQLAIRVNLPRSTVQRIVAALAQEHILISASANARVKLGPTILRLAANTHFDFVNVIRPHLERLSHKINETVDLSMQRTDHMVFVDQIASSHRLSAISHIGESLPMYSAANGKAALSKLSDEEISFLVKDSFVSETANTVESIPALIEQIRQIRKTEIAIDREEHVEGICAIGTAFCDPLGRIFAASIPVPSVRFYRLEQSLIKALLEFRREAMTSIAELG